MNTTAPGADGRLRCRWCVGRPEYERYHDEEWGWPVTDDRRLFEKLCLEAFQAGLSWYTILAKRANFRAAFAEFDWVRMAEFGPQQVAQLLGNAGIVRHRGKIEAVLHNAALVPALIAEAGSLSAFLWRYAPAQPSDGLALPAQTAESLALSKALKQRGWKFVGPTTMYALMQSMGMVNDHAPGCVLREPVERVRREGG